MSDPLRRRYGELAPADQARWHRPDAPVDRPVVLAFGGNALLPGDEDPQGVEDRSREFARALARILPADAGLVLVHGNGPQVGMILLRVEATRDQVPPESLDVMVAETQGSIGYLLARALRNAFRQEDMTVEVATVVTQVLVDATDPAFREPTKPVGPFYEERRYVPGDDWDLTHVNGRGYRRVVPSPVPLDVVELHTIEDGVSHGHVVIAGGGGGVPVIDQNGRLEGVEAVIDKDRTATLLAISLDAQSLVVLTAVPHVYERFGTDSEKPIPVLEVARAQRLLESGEFPPGSMGPKIEATCAFTEATGRASLITDVEHVDEALAGRAGTWIVADKAELPIEVSD